MTSLHSSVEQKGKVVTQITGFETEDGRKVYVNTQNVNWFDIITNKGVCS